MISIEAGSCRGSRRFRAAGAVSLAVFAYGLSMVFSVAVPSAYEIGSASMSPTMAVRDRIVAERVTLRFDPPSPGDVVLIDDPEGGRTPFVKRVIALAGQTVDLRDGAVWVDGRRLDEPYTRGIPTVPASVRTPATVPGGHVWVMGDNRSDSRDSRAYGPLPLSAVQARCLCVYWPAAHAGGLGTAE